MIINNIHNWIKPTHEKSKRTNGKSGEATHKQYKIYFWKRKTERATKGTKTYINVLLFKQKWKNQWLKDLAHEWAFVIEKKMERRTISGKECNAHAYIEQNKT